MNISRALLVSFMGHCILLVPIGIFPVLFSQHRIKEPRITYYYVKPINIEKPLTLQVSKGEGSANPSSHSPAMQTLEITGSNERKMQIAKKDRIRHIRSITKPAQGRGNGQKIIPQEESPLAKTVEIPNSIPGTTMPNTPECMDYYRYIREEIRQFLEKNYRSRYGEGDVVVAFVLEKNGRLNALKVVQEKSADDPVLRRLAYDSIRISSPFKPFPNMLPLKHISFNLTVVFKKR